MMQTLVLIAVCAAAASGNDEGHPATSPVVTPRSSGIENVLFLGVRPYLMRFHLFVDGQPWADVRQQMVDDQFRRLDQNTDGYLSLMEIASTQLLTASERLFKQADQDPRDDQLSTSEFQELIETQGFPSFMLAEGVGPAASRIKLFPHLDHNNDGRITQAEAAASATSLGRLDYDDDESVSTTELSPFRNQLIQNRIRGREKAIAADAPFTSWGSTDDLPRVAEIVIRRYGQDTSSDKIATPTGQPRCQVRRLGSAKVAATPFDQNGDDYLDAAEMVAFLAEFEPQLELRVDLALHRATRPKLTLLHDGVSANPRRFRRPRSRVSWNVDSTSFEFRGMNYRSKSRDNRNFYLVQFLRADENKNQYLEEDEFPRVGLGQPFSAVDRNQDEKIDREELELSLKSDAFANESQCVLSVASDTRTLFQTLDANGDLRLTERELKQMDQRLMTMDQDHDGAVSTSEVTESYRLVFSLGRPRVYQQAQVMQNENDVPPAQATTIRDAPSWFTRMDRNQDGDLSWREFLGSRTQFATIDADGDHLITADEAKQVTE